MSTPLLATKLYIPPPRPNMVIRPRLVERLNEGFSAGNRLSLISAPAGFGKTTLVSEWLAGREQPQREIRVAWLSLDEEDSDLRRFLTYFVAALQTVAPKVGAAILAAIQSPQPLPVHLLVTALLNELAALADHFVLVLDDYHTLDSKPVDQVLVFLVEHLPPQMHLVIAGREDPQLPLARLRARGQLTELRAADLRFTPAEAAEFLNRTARLNLSAEDIAELEARTEGWIAGLQLAAISMQGRPDAAGFIRSFTGSHHFVLDYLAAEVLQRQPDSVQTFLLCTSILNRLCGSLCEAVLQAPSGSGQETLEYLERANLFIVPLDNERRWYRYHHLFGELLRQRLNQRLASSTGDEGQGVADYHVRASQWYEDHDLELEAFHHATAANDIERAERLMEGKGLPLQFRGASAPVINWLESLPKTVLDARPSLWVAYASALTMVGKPATNIEEILQAAEAALQGAEPDDRIRDLVGHIAAIRAMLAVPRNQVETIITQSRRALEYLHPDNLPVRTTTTWTLGYAYQLQGNLAKASQAFTEAISISRASGNTMITLAATTSLGQVQEAENLLYLAAENYRRVLQLVGDPPWAAACEAYLGLARVYYQWNDLDAAEQFGQQSLQLAQQMENVDTPAACGVFLARLKLAQGDTAGAASILAHADQFVRQHNSVSWMPEIVAAQVLTVLHQGNLAAAAHLAQAYELPISQARVHLAQGDTSAALAALEPLRQQVEAKGCQDERLRVMVLQVVALDAHGEKVEAVQLLGDALVLAEPGGFIRIFVDEGLPMAQLLSEVAAHGIMPDYTGKLLAAFKAEAQPGLAGRLASQGKREDKSGLSPAQTLIEPLSQRELGILQLIAQGLSNREISERLFLALDTVKGHNRIIFDKLQVHSRTEAVARAHELGLV